MVLPLVLFPGWLGTLAMALPWSAFVQVPADIWLGKHPGVELLPGARVPAGLGRRPARLLRARAPARRPARWWSRVADAVHDPRRRRHEATPTSPRLWVRAAWAYPTSFLMLIARQPPDHGLDFVGIWVMFASIDPLGGFGLREVALLYGATGVGHRHRRHADRQRRADRRSTSGPARLDQMLTKPVPLLVQVCADQFTLRRLGRITQAGVVFAWAATYVDWTPSRVVVAVVMVVSATVIFFALFVGLLVHPVLDDRRHRVRQRLHLRRQHPDPVPAHHLPARGDGGADVRPADGVRELVPLPLPARPRGSVRPARRGSQFCSPVAAVVTLAGALLVWRAGVRHYTSTGS